MKSIKKWKYNSFLYIILNTQHKNMTSQNNDVRLTYVCALSSKKLSCRRDRARTLRVIEYFAKSLEVIRNNTVE